MNGRLWYPQLDVYDCIRRLGAMLAAYSDPPGVERLYIADFYLANPPLLHRCQMSRETRKAFRGLNIPRPEKTFLTYPAPPLLFKKMEPIQKEAIRAMAGKGLISVEQFQRGFGELTEEGGETFGHMLMDRLSDGEGRLIQFLTMDFAGSGEMGSVELRRSTGLRRSGW